MHIRTPLVLASVLLASGAFAQHAGKLDRAFARKTITGARGYAAAALAHQGKH